MISVYYNTCHHHQTCSVCLQLCCRQAVFGESDARQCRAVLVFTTTMLKNWLDDLTGFIEYFGIVLNKRTIIVIDLFWTFSSESIVYGRVSVQRIYTSCVVILTWRYNNWHVGCLSRRLGCSFAGRSSTKCNKIDILKFYALQDVSNCRWTLFY